MSLVGCVLPPARENILTAEGWWLCSFGAQTEWKGNPKRSISAGGSPALHGYGSRNWKELSLCRIGYDRQQRSLVIFSVDRCRALHRLSMLLRAESPGDTNPSALKKCLHDWERIKRCFHKRFVRGFHLPQLASLGFPSLLSTLCLVPDEVSIGLIGVKDLSQCSPGIWLGTEQDRVNTLIFSCFWGVKMPHAELPLS